MTFTFGSSSGEQNKKSNTDQEAESAGKLPATFRFGATSANSSEPGEKETTAAPTFTFGSSTFNHDSKDGTAKAPTFTFGASSSSDKDKAASRSIKFGESSALDKQGTMRTVVCLFGFCPELYCDFVVCLFWALKIPFISFSQRALNTAF